MIGLAEPFERLVRLVFILIREYKLDASIQRPMVGLIGQASSGDVK